MLKAPILHKHPEVDFYGRHNVVMGRPLCLTPAIYLPGGAQITSRTLRNITARILYREQVLSSSRDGRPFGHNRHGPKTGGQCPFGGRSWVPTYHNVARAEAYVSTKWRLDPPSRLATTNMGRKLGRLRPFGGGVAGSPSNTMWPGPRPTPLPGGILIYPAVWPQHTWT